MKQSRNEAGVTEKDLLHNVVDTNEVVILFEAADLDCAKPFAESADLLEKMRRRE